jgi:hypothetical protein
MIEFNLFSQSRFLQNAMPRSTPTSKQRIFCCNLMRFVTQIKSRFYNFASGFRTVISIFILIFYIKVTSTGA